jgi:hypothetical protein
MSALELNEREDLADVLHFAPPRVRHSADESTIRPVLERLSRGEKQGHSDAAAVAQPLAKDAPIVMQAMPRAPKIPFSMAGRLALAMGIVAALAIPAVAFLKPRVEQPTSPAAPAAAPTQISALKKAAAIKKVHTISFQPKDPTAPETHATLKQPASSAVQQSAPPSTRPASPPARREASASGGIATASASPGQPRVQSALALTSPLKLWAEFPGDPASAAWGPPVGPSKVNRSKEKSADAVAPEHAARVRNHHRAAAARPVQHHARHARRHRRHYSRRHRARRRAAPTSRTQQTAQAADSQTATTAATKPNPVQAVINAILGKNSGQSRSAEASPQAPLRQ